jgi:hypothetical protein
VETSRIGFTSECQRVDTTVESRAKPWNDAGIYATLHSSADAPRYFGPDKNRFSREVRPFIVLIRIGAKGIAFDRIDLDAWADRHKCRNGCPAAQTERSKPWEIKKMPTCDCCEDLRLPDTPKMMPRLLARHSIHRERAGCIIGCVVPSPVEPHSGITSAGWNAAVVTLVGDRHIGTTLGCIPIP